MLTLRKSRERGYADHGWLKSHHSFSFADYHDPAHMGVGNLRVINEDRIAAGTGFGTHGHRDMEIVSYVLEGALAHTDSMGNGSEGGAHRGVIQPGDVQRMSAGTGVRHSEYNHSKDGTTHFLQIWIIPDGRGQPPSWGAKPFPKGDRSGQFVALASGVAGDEDALPIRTDARVLGATLKAGESTEYTLGPGRRAYLVSASGAVDIDGIALSARDGAAIRDVASFRVTAQADAELVLVDSAA